MSLGHVAIVRLPDREDLVVYEVRAGHDAVPWMRRLSRIARLLLEQGTFPDRYPPNSF